MPIGRVTEYAAIADELEARERMAYVTDTAAATGNLKKGVGGRHMKDLRRQATGRHHRAAKSISASPTSVPSAASLAEFGISVTEVKANG